MKNKTLGWFFLVLAIFIFSPIPDPTDFLGLKLYSMYSGVEFSLDNLSSIYLDYFIFTTIIALILFTISMHLLGWNLKRLWKKLDIGKYKIALAVGVLVVAVIAYLDVQGLIFFSELGRDYTTGDFPQEYWIAFRNMAYLMMGLIALGYYFWVRKDKSETLAVFLTPFILFWCGLADIFYFVFQKVSIPQTLPWLNNHFPIGWISQTLGFDGVTNVSLIISVIFGAVLVFFMAKILKERF